jgi:peptide/nickel transport system substrate-binding protein
MPPPEQWGGLLTPNQARAFNHSLPQYSYSLAKAKAELAKSSQYADGGFNLTLPFPDAEATLGKAALQLSQSLKKLNINLTVKQQPVDQWFATIYAHKNPLGLQIVSWGVDYPDPADALHFIYDSKGAVANNFNTANYKSPKMDSLLAKQQNARTPAARTAALKQAFRLAANDVPYIPIWYQQIAMAVSNKLNYPGWGTWYLYTPWALQISAK